MMLPHMIVSLRAPLITDSKGNQVHDWVHAVVGGPWRAFVQPAQSTEELVNQDRIISRWKLFAEPAADILGTDRVGWNGVTFFVDGEIQLWDTGEPHHYEGYLRRVVGA